MSDEIRMTNDDSEGGRGIWCATADFEAFWEAGDEGPCVLREDAPVNSKRVFDLEERTARFGEAVIAFAKRVPFNPVNNRLIDQIVGAAKGIHREHQPLPQGIS